MPGLNHAWGSDPDTHADFVHGGVDPADFEEPRYRRPPRRKPKKKKKGCPGNDFGPHVYVWQPVFSDWFSNMYEVKVCCGCERRGSKSRRIQT